MESDRESREWHCHRHLPHTRAPYKIVNSAGNLSCRINDWKAGSIVPKLILNSALDHEHAQLHGDLSPALALLVQTSTTVPPQEELIKPNGISVSLFWARSSDNPSAKYQHAAEKESTCIIMIYHIS
eukprot:SAG31_NODE_224_length_19856_cov_33.632890_15_plen_127_part_00